MEKIRFCILLGILFGCSAYLTGQTEPKKNTSSFMDWLQEQPKEVTLVLETDLTYLYENRRKQAYQPALFSALQASEDVQMKVEVKTRGKFRCIRCDFPPLKLKFEKDTLKAAGFRKWNELKIALPCLEGDKAIEWLYKEYLVYRLYNLLTDWSFRVKLVKFEVKDPQKPTLNHIFPAFVIEHEEEVANRLRGKAVDSLPIEVDQLSPDEYTRYQVFQFMIGNTDWIPVTGHNMSVVKTKDDQKIPLPFDFDFAGLVRTDYAVPRSDTGLEDVEERFFMGNHKTREELEPIFAFFRQKQQAMNDLINQFDLLDKSERKRMIQFLDSFFSIINKPKEVDRYFVNRPPYREGMY